MRKVKLDDSENFQNHVECIKGYLIQIRFKKGYDHVDIFNNLYSSTFQNEHYSFPTYQIIGTYTLSE